MKNVFVKLEINRDILFFKPVT